MGLYIYDLRIDSGPINCFGFELFVITRNGGTANWQPALPASDPTRHDDFEVFFQGVELICKVIIWFLFMLEIRYYDMSLILMKPILEPY